MKFTKRLLSSVVAFSMVFACWMPVPAQAAEGEEREVDSESAFLDALKDSSISKITIVKDFHFKQPESDEVFVIPERDQPIMITAKAEINVSLPYAGIILGGDTTFENMTLTFLNPVRNAIIANGHTLTLDNVSPSGSNWSTHLFCGKLTDYIGKGKLPTAGSNGKVIVRGNSKVGDIFAGSLSDVGNDSQDKPNSFDCPATIRVEEATRKNIGTIYGCGARENRSGTGNGSADAWYADADKYKVTDEVTIDIKDSSIQHIKGDTGSSTGANVIYQDSAGSFDTNLQFEDIRKLDLRSGKLEPRAGSTFSRDHASLQVRDDAQFYLTNLGQSIEVKDFTGGGVLVFQQGQQLIVEGQVNKKTRVAAGGVDSTSTNSTELPKEGHVYIEAVQSRDGDFALLPYSTKPDMKLVRNNQGQWIATNNSAPSEQKLLLESISLPPTMQTTNETPILIPVNVQYAENSMKKLENIPFEAKKTGDGSYTQSQYDGSQYICAVSINGVGLKLSFGVYDINGSDQEALCIENSSDDSIPNGKYAFDILIPKQYIKNSIEDRQLSIVVTVSGETPPVPPSPPTPVPPTPVPPPVPPEPPVPPVVHTVSRPTAQTGLVYNGQKQVGVVQGSGYVVSGNEGTAAGSYQATVVLAADFQWDDGKTDSMTLDWTIAPKPLTIQSASLKQKTYDGSTEAQVENAVLAGMVSGETLQFNTDYTASAVFDDPNAGANKTAHVTVKLAERVKNYILENSVFQLTGQSILQKNGASAPNVSGRYDVSTKNPNTFRYTIDPINGAEYKMDSGNWQDDNTFDNIQPLSTHTFTARIKATANQMAGAEGTSASILFEKLKHNTIPPLSVTLSGESGNRTVTIGKVEGAEYSFDGGNSYHADNRKDGCSGTVDVVIRYKETAVYHASQPAKQSINTDKQSQAALSIDAVGDKTYGDAPFVLTAKGGTGNGAIQFVSSDRDVLEINGNTAAIHKAGDVTITVTKEADADYNAASAMLDLKIEKKALTIKAKDQRIAVGAAMPELTFEVQGLVQGDTFTAPVITTTAKDTNTSGTFDITVSGGTLTHAESYAVTYEGGVLTISKEMYTLTVTNGSGSGAYPAGQSVTITADTRSGYAFTGWTSDSGIVFADPASQTTTFTMPDHAAMVTANYKALSNGGSSGSSGGGSSSSSNSGSSDKTETHKNPDGSVTVRSKKSNGTIVEKTQNPDGSQEIVETHKDGTITTTQITKAGDRTKTVSKEDGSSLTHIKQKDGIAAVIAVDTAGIVNAQVQLPEKNPTQDGTGSVLLPVPRVSVPKDESKAPTIQITTKQAEQIYVTIPTEENTSGIVAVVQDADGNQRVLPKSMVDAAGVHVMLETPTVVRLVDRSKTFTDVPPTHWASDSINFVTARGIYSGASQDTFEPEGTMTRAMLVKVLYNLESQPKIVGNTSFGDIPSNSWYADAVQWAAETGLVSGASADRFEPNGNMTREQLAVILYRYQNQPEVMHDVLAFEDVGQISLYAQEAMQWAVEQKIIRGTEENRLEPKQQLDRAECAAILMRCLQAQK